MDSSRMHLLEFTSFNERNLLKRSAIIKTGKDIFIQFNRSIVS